MSERVYVVKFFDGTKPNVSVVTRSRNLFVIAKMAVNALKKYASRVHRDLSVEDVKSVECLTGIVFVDAGRLSDAA